MKAKILKFLNKEITFFKPKPGTSSVSTFEVAEEEGRQPEVTICLSDVSKKETETILRGNFKSLSLAGNTSLFQLEKDNFSFVSLSVHITSLDLSFCSIKGNGVLFFASLLRGNKTLEHLDISNNNLESTCLSAVENSHLKSLDIHANNLLDTICSDIVNNFKLNSLDISSNQITDVGAESLSKSSSLESLAINNNQISFSGADSFLESNLKEIFLNNNAMSVSEEDDFFFLFYENVSRAEMESLGLVAVPATDFAALDW